MYALGRKKSSVCCVIPKTALQDAGIEVGNYVKIRTVGRVIVIEGIAETNQDSIKEVGVPRSPDPRAESRPRTTRGGSFV